MSFLQTVKPEAATGKVAEVYKGVLERLGMVPAPLQLMSASPDLLALQSQIMGYFMTHPNLSPGLLALVRLLVAEEHGYNYCVSFNKNILKMVGVVDDDTLAAIMADPGKAPLPEKEVAMLKYVVKVCTRPAEVTQDEVQQLRDLGWQDSDIFDAMMHGLGMVVSGMLEKAVGLPDGAAC